MTWLAWYLAHKDLNGFVRNLQSSFGILTFVPDRGFPVDVLAEQHDVTLQLDCGDVIVHVAWIAPTKPVNSGHKEASF